jgi:23S rRNA pseudouridine1911/1915/1917 synthase
MSYIGHPIASDVAYGYNKNLSYGTQFPRVMLHAYKIKFKHPMSDKLLDITAPLPNDFKESLEKLNAF